MNWILHRVCCAILKACLNDFGFCPTFHLPNLLSECWVHLNRSVSLSKALKNVESLSNGSQIKLEFDETFCLTFNLLFFLSGFKTKQLAD